MRTLTTIALGLMLVLGASRAFAQEPSHEGHEGTTTAPAPGEGDQPMEKEPAHPMGPGGMGKGMGHGMEMGQGMGMGQGKGMCMGKDMPSCMQAMKDHSKMMEGITDQKKLDVEMKKHMRMMDDMMESMMNSQGHSAPGAPSSAPPAGAKP